MAPPATAAGKRAMPPEGDSPAAAAMGSMTEQEPQAAGCAEAGDLVLVADCGAEVDVVDPDPRAAHDAEPAPGELKDVAADLGPGPDDERVAERDLGAELLGAEAVGAVDVGELAQQREPPGAELLGDKHHGLPRDGPGGRRLGGRGGCRGRRRHEGRGEARALGVGVGLRAVGQVEEGGREGAARGRGRGEEEDRYEGQKGYF